ncbi:MAG: BrnA antitoxin family protein [Gemmatimonadaceae bacterium]
MTDVQAQRGAARDVENPLTDAAWLAAGHVVEPVKKQAMSLRLDPEVVDWFRSTGPRYQSRMNAVLRAFVEHQRQRQESRTKRKRAG